MANANPWAVVIPMQWLRRIRSFINAGNRAVLMLVPVIIIGTIVNLPPARPKVSAALNPVLLYALSALVLLFIVYGFVSLLLHLAIDFELIRCARCGGTFFDPKVRGNMTLPRNCKCCGCDIASSGMSGAF